nr:MULTISPECIES: helix-turn-helix domain-containing protein [Frankia]
MAQDGFPMATPRPSARPGRSGAPQGAPLSGRTAPAGSPALRFAPTGSSRPRASSGGPAGMPSATAPGTPAGASSAATPPVAPLAPPPLSPPETRPSVSGGSTGGAARLGAVGAATSGGGTAPAAGGPAVRPADDDDVLTVDELVAWLRLSESTVLKLLSERAIPARKVGHQWRVRRGRVRDWLDGRE